MDRQRMTGCAEPKAQSRSARVGWITRRGVVAIVAMMFLVLFVTLSVAMAVASKGNLRTAETHIQVLRATAAAETGLEIGVARLRAAAGRFVVARSTMDGAFVQRLWGGGIESGDGRVVRLDPVGYSESVRASAGPRRGLIRLSLAKPTGSSRRSRHLMPRPAIPAPTPRRTRSRMHRWPTGRTSAWLLPGMPG